MLTLSLQQALLQTNDQCGRSGAMRRDHEDAVLKEQLEYLIRHASEDALCDCSVCLRYLRVRSALLEIFEEPNVRTQRVGGQTVIWIEA